MKKPLFDDWDHFKGDFKSKPKESKATSGDALIHYQGLFGIDPADYSIWKNTGINSGGVLTLDKIQKAINNLMHNSNYGIYGTGYLYYDGSNTPQQISYSNVNNPGKCAILNGFDDDPPTCDHDPIDVGFMKPKMVCRKCDKDL